MRAPNRVDDPVPVAEADALRATLAAAGTGTWHWDAATGLVHWDETLEALSGMAPGEFGATYEAWLESLHPDEREGILALVGEALDRRGPYRFEHRTIWPDGTVRWLECRGQVLTDAEGNPAGTVGCAVDVTARKEAELGQRRLLEDVANLAERLARLQRISQRLGSALTADEVITAVLDGLDPPAGATARGLWLVEPSGRALVLAGQRGMQPEAAERFGRIDVAGDLPGAMALRTRQTVVSPSDEDGERFPDLRSAPRTGRGFVAVPLLVEGVPLGVLAFGFDGPLDDADVTFLEAAGGTIAQTLQRVRLAETLQRRSDEVAFLAGITRAASTATDHRDLMRRIADATIPRLGDLCAIHFLPEPGARIETVAAHTDPALAGPAADLAGRLPYEPSRPEVARVLDTAQAELISLEGETTRGPGTGEPADDDGTAPTLGELGLSSAVTVPLRVQDGTIGAIQIFAGRNHPAHTAHDLALAQAVADGIGEALAERWLTDQHRHISSTLQRAFLPPNLPPVPGVEVAAAYWPVGEANEVGGDFYDLFALGEHEWAVLIGDACGSGPDAAATAAIARHTARAAARHRLGHHEVLEWVNQAVKHSDRNLFCTACYATITARPGEGVELAVAVAGHPLPILVGPDGAAVLGTPGTLLGVLDDPTFEIRRHHLAPGEAVVFYTDGITDLPPPHGRHEDELRALLAEASAPDAAGLVKVLREDLDERAAAHGRADDVAVLVLRHAAG